MSIRQLDIWNQWHRDMALVIKGGNPIIDGGIYVYTNEHAGHAHACGCEDHEHCGCGHAHDGYGIQNDAFINMLYFAAVRAKAGVRVFGLGDEDFAVSFDELKTIGTPIDQLSTLFGYKTGQISLEQFAQEFKDQTVYYSTLAGEDDRGETKMFACASGDDAAPFYPVFLTGEHLREFFEQYQRTGYVILENTLGQFLSLLDSNDQLKAFGAVIEPLYSCNVAFPPGFRVG